MRLALIVLAAAACGGAPSKVESGAGAPVVAQAGQGDPRCEAVRGKIEQLYRVEAQARDLKRVDEAVADNTAMVLRDCGKAPEKVPDCVRAVKTSQELETTCLAPLDDEGSEGDRLAH